MEYRNLKAEEVVQAVEIFRHEHLKYMDGSYPEANWIEEFISGGYARVFVNEEKIMAALVAEPLLAGGVYLWLIAVRKEDIGKGYGQQLLDYFMEEMQQQNKHWVFLTSGVVSQNFYARNGFLSGKLDVKEYCRVL